MGIFKPDCSGSVSWEPIEPKGKWAPQYMRRAKVFGGWLVETASHSSSSGGLTFLPDPKHEWKLDDNK